MKAKIGPSKVPGKKAGPNGSFPIGDKKHARVAIGGATRSERADNISASEATSIKTKARKVLGEGNGHDSKSADQMGAMHQVNGKAGHHNYS